jgi:hypothetical protein
MTDKLILQTVDGTDLVFDLKELARLESRKKELSYVNKETAADLLHDFNEGYAEVSRLSLKILHEYERMVLKTKERKARVILDIAPDELKKRNLLSSKAPSGSADQREAVLDMDKEYNELCEKASALKAAYQFFKIRAKSLEMSYQAVKKVIDPNGNYGSNMSAPREIEDDIGTVGEPRFSF